jgi:ubiquinone/menaquinone biosynthesis C-methylase UbiE
VRKGDFTPEEISEVVERVERRDEELRRFGFDIRAAISGILEKALPLPEPVLEVATGKGRFLTALASHVSEIVTVDVDASEQKVAKILALFRGVADRIEFLEADATSLPFPDRSFGSIVSMNTFHHLENPHAVLKEMTRLVGPNAKVVISDFDEKGYAAMERLHAAEGRKHPRSPLSMQEIAEFWRKNGWEAEIATAPCQEIVIAHRPQLVRH